jgi:flagellar protein FlaG
MPINSSMKIVEVSREENVTKRQLNSAVAQANKVGELLDKRLSFDIDSKTNKVIVKVVDKSTGNVVRVLPPEEMLRMAAHLKKLKVLNDKVIGAAESVILDNKH